LPVHWFADYQRGQPGEWDREAHLADTQSELDAALEDGRINMDKLDHATEQSARRRGSVRNLASFSLFVGEGLEKVLRIGDRLRFSHHGDGAFSYNVQRDSVTVFSAGSLQTMDGGGPFAIWQDNEAYSKADETLVQARPATIHEISERMQRLGEFADSHHVYVTVRILDRMFRLASRQVACVDPYYVFLARTNSRIQSAGYPEPGIHAAGRLDAPGIALIEDAAEQLIAPKTRLLMISVVDVDLVSRNPFPLVAEPKSALRGLYAWKLEGDFGIPSAREFGGGSCSIQDARECVRQFHRHHAPPLSGAQ
jgi:hypothetical protein